MSIVSCLPEPLWGAEQQRIDEFWMQQAMQLADYARQIGEVPVGALLVEKADDGSQNQFLVAQGYNQTIQQHDPTAHAEVVALRQAGQVKQNYRLPGLSLYVTLEPCSMCAKAMVHARIERLIYAASDPRTGAAGSVLNILQKKEFNHQVSVTSGVLAETCSKQLSDFFRQKRQAQQERKATFLNKNTLE